MSQQDDSPPDEPADKTSSVNRRQFVKALGAASSAAGIGALGVNSASADQEPHALSKLSSEEKSQLDQKLGQVQTPYNTPAAARKAIRTYGDELLDELERRDVITSPSELKTDEFTPREQLSAEREGMGITAFLADGVPTTHIHTSVKTGDHHLTVVVEPQLDRSYAILKQSPQDLESAKIIDPTAESVDATQAESAANAGKYCLHQSSDADPTPGDNCLLKCEEYEFYCSADNSSCYLGSFTQCCDDPCLDSNMPCVYSLQCYYCDSNGACG